MEEEQTSAENISDRIKKVLGTKNVTFADAARMLNMGETAIWRAITGKSRPGSKLLYKYGKYLNINLYFLLYGKMPFFLRADYDVPAWKYKPFLDKLSPDEKAFFYYFFKSQVFQFSVIGLGKKIMLMHDELIMSEIMQKSEEELEILIPSIPRNIKDENRPGTAKAADFGNRAKEIRLALGLSLSQLAGKMNLAPSSLSRVEAHQSMPGIGYVMYMHEKLGVNLYYLFFGKGDMFEKPDDETYFFPRWKYELTEPVEELLRCFFGSNLFRYGILSEARALMLKEKSLLDQELKQYGYEVPDENWFKE